MRKSKIALLGAAFAGLAASIFPTQSAASGQASEVSVQAFQGLRQAGASVPKAALPADNLAVNVAPKFLGEGPAVVVRRPGMTPKQWGMSAACHKMVRKNRLIARGISAQRI